MPLTSFCGLLTLQVGASVLSSVFLTLVGVILVANIFDYHNNSDGWPVSLILLILFVIGLGIAGILMFASSYAENRSLAMLSILVIIILTCYWIILCCFSFVSNPEHIKAVCIATRCPESFWIANLGYRSYIYNGTEKNLTKEATTKKAPTIEGRRRRFALGESEDGPITPYYFTIELQHQNNQLSTKPDEDDNRQTNTEKTEEPAFEAEMLLSPNTLKRIISNYKGFYFLKANSTEEGKEEGSRYVYGFPMVGAIFTFVVNFIFLIFSALVMWSWASELDWADYYIEDEPVVIYEDYP